MSLALSPDALSIAVASASRLSVHGASAGSRERQYVQQGQLARRYACCAWSKDAALVACGSGDGAVVVWDVKRGLVKATLTPPGALANAGVVGVDFSADGAELYACYALPGGAFARHVARWAVAGGEPAAWDGDKRGTTGTGAKRALAGTHATEVRRLAWTASGRYVSLGRDARSVLVHDCTKAKDGVWSLRLAAPGLEVCARAAPRAEGEEAVEVAVCLGDGRLQVASTASSTPRRLDGRRDALAVAFVGDDLRAARGAASAPSAAAVDVARDAGVCAAADGGAAPPAPRGERAGRRGSPSSPRCSASRRSAPLRLRPDGEDGAARKRAKAAAATTTGAATASKPWRRREAQTAADLAADAGHAAAADDGSGASLAAVLDQAVRCGDDALSRPAEVTPLNVVAADATDDDDDDDDDDDMEEEDDDDDDESEEEEDDDDDGVVGRRRRVTHAPTLTSRRGSSTGAEERLGGARRGGLFVGSAAAPGELGSSGSSSLSGPRARPRRAAARARRRARGGRLERRAVAVVHGAGCQPGWRQEKAAWTTSSCAQRGGGR
ncbi:hypothetical protein JL722_4989 [Aureococcus anophagefferens]|nr:hypothetical protein JL722_4989 [Aureococcus anophagefferens]